MKNANYLVLLLCLTLYACSESDIKDEVIPEETEGEIQEGTNLPPNDFEIYIGSVRYNIASISWGKAYDPENNPVSYAVFLNDSLVQGNIERLYYSFEDLLEDTEYSGVVVASDSFGNETEESFAFTTPNYYLRFQKQFETTESGNPHLGGQPWDIVKTANGEYIIVGKSPKPDGSASEVFAMKVDYNGNEIWKKYYGFETGEVWPIKVATTLDGGVLVADRHIVLKIDDYGNEVWHTVLEDYIDYGYSFLQTFGELKSVKQDSKGDIYAIGGRQLSPSIGSHGVVTKLSSFGTIIWEKTYQFAFTINYFDDLIITSEDEVVIVGTTETTGLTMEEYLGQNWNLGGGPQVDYWVLKLNTFGDVLWERTYGDGKFDFARQLIETNNKDLVFAGFSWGAYDISNGTVYRLDTNGNLLWNITTSLGVTNSIAETQDGDLVTAGEVTGGFYGWFAINKINSNGEFIWLNDYDMALVNVMGRAIIVEEDNGFRAIAGIRFNPKIILLKTDSEGYYVR